MSEIKPIRNNTDYEVAITELRSLIELNPEAGSDEDAQIGVLSTLIENYESSILPDYEADPIEAIRLRLEQLGLKDKDLAQYLGSASRVSEILSGKRPLTVSMIKNLEEGLGISASLLIGSSSDKKNKRWTHKTLELMAQRGYFGDTGRNLSADDILSQGLLRAIFNPQVSIVPSLLRQSNYRDVSNVDRFHMDAWSKKVIDKGIDIVNTEQVSKFDHSKVDAEDIRELIKFSTKEDGVLVVIKRLLSLGIVVVIEPHLPNTRLDGATFFTDNNPIIGITLRYNRLDSFWFTLAHELAHVLLHSQLDTKAFLDKLFGNTEEVSLLENQADQLAGDLLIPASKWKVSPLRYGSTPTLVKKFANEIGVHDSVVAGRIRHDSGDWAIHTDSVNSFDVRGLFGDIRW